MENPYSHAAPAAPATPDAQRRLDYEAAIGPNTGYYLKYFEQFDAGESRASWNWAALLAPPWWCIYRKLWLPGMLALVWPWIVLFTMAIPYAVLRPPIVVMIVIAAVVLVTPYILLPVYANALYWRHIHGLIRRLPKSVASVPEKRIARLERNGGTGIGPMFGVMAVAGFLLIAIAAIVAAYSIPAYQDYNTRAQVTEGLNLARSAKAEVAEYYAQKKAWPEQSDLGHDPLSGKYVSSVVVKGGSVVITYGNEAHASLKDQRLALLPAVSANGVIVWACGNRPIPDGFESGNGPSGTDLFEEQLPASCRAF